MGERGFFVVGTGRCGSTLLRRLLRLHPDAWVVKETHWIPLLFDFFGHREIELTEFFDAARLVYMAKGKTAYERILGEEGLDHESFAAALAPAVDALPRRDLAGIMTVFYRELARRHGASVWGDKTPDYGLCMGTLQSLWPEAKFVHIVRDGRDVAISMSDVLSFRLQVAWGVNYWPAIAWRRAYRARLAVARGEISIDRFFELWRSRLLRIRDESGRLSAGSYLEITYEELLEEPEKVLDRTATFLGLVPSRDWLEAATAQVRRDDRRRHADSPDYLGLCERHGDTLRSLGFGA
ncbi:MAG: sulfotransferase [Proteobacteria bacterium]|nr:sulfotransferase [Pseudomonadota bacterium]